MLTENNKDLVKALKKVLPASRRTLPWLGVPCLEDSHTPEFRRSTSRWYSHSAMTMGRCQLRSCSPLSHPYHCSQLTIKLCLQFKWDRQRLDLRYAHLETIIVMRKPFVVRRVPSKYNHEWSCLIHPYKRCSR